jgi:AcrR family transcriptional regulator
MTVNAVTIDSPARIIDVPTARRRPTGRPPRRGTDQIVLRATIELLTEGGLAATTVDAIARRSGFAKTTIYRRWPSRDALILQAFRMAVQGTDAEVVALRALAHAAGPIQGSASDMLRVLGNPLFRAVFPTIVRELLGETSLGARYRVEVFRPVRSALLAELAERRDRGEFRSDVDPNLLFDIVNGAMLYRAMLGERIDESVAQAVADLLLNGARGDGPATRG